MIDEEMYTKEGGAVMLGLVLLCTVFLPVFLVVLGYGILRKIWIWLNN